MAQYEVEGPDGKRYIVEAVAEEPSKLRQAANAVGRFGADFAAGFGKMASEAPRVAGWLGTSPIATPSSEKFRMEMEAASKRGFDRSEQFGKEQGQGPGYGKSIAESLGGGLAAGGVTPAALAAAAGAGAGGEAAAQGFGDSFLTRGLGALAGGGVVGAASSFRNRKFPNTEALAKEGLEGIDEAMLAKASEFMRRQKKDNLVDVDLVQALEAVGASPGNLKAIRDFLADRPQGDELQRIMRAQPGQLSVQSSVVMGGMPGTNFGTTQTANNLQEAATKAVNAVKKQRSDMVSDMYRKAGVLTPDQVKALDSQMEQLLAEPGLATSVKSAIQTFRNRLSGRDEAALKAVEDARTALAEAKDPRARMAAQQALAQANEKLASATQTSVRALDVNRWIGEMAGTFKATPLTVPDAQAVGQLKNVAGRTNERFRTMSPEIAAADDEFKRLSQELVNPVKQSVVGRFAGRAGYREDVEARMTAFEQLMQRGTDKDAKVSDIRTLGEQLAKVDKDAFSDALKSYISRQLKRAMEPGPDSKTAANNPTMAGRIAQNLWGNELQAQGLRDAISIAAKVHGQNPDLAIRGLNNFMQLVRAMEARAPRVGGITPDDILRMSGRNPASEFLRVFGFLPFERSARRGEDYVSAQTLKAFDKMLTTPEGAKLLADLGKESVMSRRIPMLLGQFGAQFVTNPAGVMPE